MSELWTQRYRVWVPPLVFFALCLGGLIYYRVAYVGEFAGLESRLAQREAELAAAEARRDEVLALVERAETNRERIAGLYDETFATPQQRLIPTMEEVKSLARQAGLAPGSISYPEEEIEDFSLVERSFQFSVEGTYQQLRTFINFLELSPSFITLRRVGLSESSAGSQRLRIELTLSTLFSAGDGAPLAPPAGARS